MKRSLFVIVIILALLVSGCSTLEQSKDLTKDVEKSQEVVDVELEFGEDIKKEQVVVSDFGVDLLKETVSAEENVLISPISVLYALGMTANGARGETLAQMEDVFGLSVSELNEYLYSYKLQLPTDKKYELQLANAIWFKQTNDFVVSEDFLQKNVDYYDAGIYEAPFDDTTLKEINKWVADKTDGKIKDILNEIPDSARMYLINALTFDAEWQDIYKKPQVRDMLFTREDGTKEPVEMMFSEEYRYMESENATGVLKYYADRKYAFVGILPKEGITMADFVAGLDGETIQGMLGSQADVSVTTAIPKFESEYSIEMSDVLKSMGMEDAFSEMDADLTGTGQVPAGHNLHISRVIHKTYITVDEKGTKAGAVTAVEQADGAAAEMEEPKIVYLDRPFVYMIIDCEENLPLFMGTVMSVE